MSTIQENLELLHRVDYPDTRFLIHPQGDKAQVVGHFDRVDSRTGRYRPIQYVWYVDLTGDVLAQMRQAIRRFELHEVDEHLMVGDERPFDPHAPGVDPDPLDTTP